MADPISILSIATACVSLTNTITKTTVSVTSFVRSVRAARSDLDAVSRELASLKTLLELIAEDTEDVEPLPETLRKQITGILANCELVLVEVQRLVDKYNGPGVIKGSKWTLAGSEDVAKLRMSLEAHKSALEIALEMVTLSITKQIKADTGEILEDTVAIKQDTTEILEEIARLRAQLPADPATIRPNVQQPDAMLARYLDSLTTYAETVCWSGEDSDTDAEDEDEGKKCIEQDSTTPLATVAPSKQPLSASSDSGARGKCLDDKSSPENIQVGGSAKAKLRVVSPITQNQPLPPQRLDARGKALSTAITSQTSALVSQANPPSDIAHPSDASASVSYKQRMIDQLCAAEDKRMKRIELLKESNRTIMLHKASGNVIGGARHDLDDDMKTRDFPQIPESSTSDTVSSGPAASPTKEPTLTSSLNMQDWIKQYTQIIDVIKYDGNGIPLSMACVHKKRNEKMFLKVERGERQQFLLELAVLDVLDHPNIVQHLKLHDAPKVPYICMVYVPGGTLLDLIIKEGKLREDRARKYARQIGSALEYCHLHCITHNWLNAKKILLTAAGDVQISGFGRVALKYDTGLAHDTRCFGAVLWHMVVGSLAPGTQIISEAQVPKHVSKDCSALLIKLLQYNQSQGSMTGLWQFRITVSTALDSKWMNQGNQLRASAEFPTRKPYSLLIESHVVDDMSGFGFESSALLAARLSLTMNSVTFRESRDRWVGYTGGVLMARQQAERRSGISRLLGPKPKQIELPDHYRSFWHLLHYHCVVSPELAMYYLTMEKLEREKPPSASRDSNST